MGAHGLSGELSSESNAWGVLHASLVGVLLLVPLLGCTLSASLLSAPRCRYCCSCRTVRFAIRSWRWLKPQPLGLYVAAGARWQPACDGSGSVLLPWCAAAYLSCSRLICCPADSGLTLLLPVLPLLRRASQCSWLSSTLASKPAA